MKKTDRPQRAEPEQGPARQVRAGISRRRLFGSGGSVLLGVCAAARAEQAGMPPDALRAGLAHAGSLGNPGPVRSADASASGLPGPNRSTSPPIVVAAPSAPQPRVAAAPQYYIDDAGPAAIALTLDDGPHPVYTPQVLEILEQYGIKATFNMIGRQIGANLSLVREVAAAGHTITNHTWDHADIRGYSTARIVSEIDRCNDALAEAGQTPTIFRAPYGYWTPTVFRACAARGLTPLGWSVDPQDWDTAHVTTRAIVNTVLRTTKAHDIILEHDGGGDRANTVAALRIFLPELLERGFVFAPV